MTRSTEQVVIDGWHRLGEALPGPLGWYYRKWARLARWVTSR